MKKLSSLLVALTLLFAIGPGTGHQMTTGGPTPPLNQIYPGPLGLASFGKVVAGEFTGDLSMDGFVLDGSEPVLVVSPELFESAVRTGTQVFDMDVLSGLAGGKDVLATVGWNGLELFERDSELLTWVVTTVRPSGSAWSNVRIVRAGDLDGDGDEDLVGVGWNSTSILVELGDGAGAFTSGAGFSSNGSGIYDVQLLNWVEAGDDPDSDEIAVFSSYGVEIYEPDGTYVGGVPWSGAPLHSTPIRDAGQVTQRLATLAHVGVNDWLTLLGGVGMEGPFNLGNLGVVSVASADADGDGDTELFVGRNNVRSLRKYENLSPGLQTFDTAFPENFGFGPQGRNPALNQAGMGLADFNGDGVLDVLAPAQGDQTGVIHVYGTTPVVQVSDANPTQYHVGILELFHLVELTESVIFTIEDPGTILAADAGQEVVLSVKVWRTPELGLPTIPETYHEELIPLPGAEGTFALPLPPGFSLQTSPDVFSVVIRQVVVENGVVVDAAPALSGLFVSESNWSLVLSLPGTSYTVSLGSGTSSPPGTGFGVGPTVPGTGSGSQPGTPTGGGG